MSDRERMHFPQHQIWIDTFRNWWRRGFALWQDHNGAEADCIFLCELGPRDYAITDADGEELSDGWQEALLLRQWAKEDWQSPREDLNAWR